MIQLLESNLKAKSKNHINPALDYLFMVNNSRYIQSVATCYPLPLLLGEDWTRMQTSKVRQNIENYLRCSRNKVLKLLKNYKSMSPDVVTKSMSLFQLDFSDICKAQSTCLVLDEGLRKTMLSCLKKMLLPLYEKFIGRFKEVDLGKDDVGQYIKYEMSDIEDQLNRLFLGKELRKESSFITIYTQRSTMKSERLEVTEKKSRFEAKKRGVSLRFSVVIKSSALLVLNLIMFSGFGFSVLELSLNFVFLYLG